MRGHRAILRRHRIAAFDTAFVAVAATASGITYAATTLPSTVQACENGSGTLSLLSSTGTCARGYSKISIGKVGPRGPQGVPGIQGVKGDQGIQGIQGPGAISLLADSTSGSNFHDKVLPGFGITARAVCSPNSQSSVYLMDSAASINFDVRGTAVRSASGSGLVVWNTGLSQNTPIPAGPSLQSYTQTATTQNAAFELVNTGGDLSADMVVTRDGRTFTLHMNTIQTANSCLDQAQVTPAS